MIPIEEARRLIMQEAVPLPPEAVPLAESLGMALARAIVAPHDVPPFANSAMDGFAVRAVDTIGAGPSHAVELILVETIRAGFTGRETLAQGQAAKIMTGAPLPRGADAVVQVEETSEAGGAVHVRLAVGPGTNVRAAGEDVARGQEVLTAGDAIGPAEIGVLASLGYAEVPVHRRPRVAILSTGRELVEVDQPLGPGQIQQLQQLHPGRPVPPAGVGPGPFGIAPDDYDQTYRMMARGWTSTTC